MTQQSQNIRINVDFMYVSDPQKFNIDTLWKTRFYKSFEVFRKRTRIIVVPDPL